jgi:hypothetical protein
MIIHESEKSMWKIFGNNTKSLTVLILTCMKQHLTSSKEGTSYETHQNPYYQLATAIPFCLPAWQPGRNRP